jgi:hypothetical protein
MNVKKGRNLSRENAIERRVRLCLPVKVIAGEIGHATGYTSTLINRLGYKSMLVNQEERGIILRLRDIGD